MTRHGPLEHIGREYMYKIPKVVIPDSAKEYRPPKVKLTLEEIKRLSDDELMMLLSGEGRSGIIPAPLLQAISYELTSRQIKKSSKPHWTIIPTFIVACIAAIAAIVSIYISLR
ncbi:hypothetical protein ACSR4G_17055 [Acinetobacter baumannii]|uniref:hypothetical protein n=1 Tax=Acinetobacter baumannii TaxID=470 RepID=UPI003EE51BB5